MLRESQYLNKSFLLIIFLKLTFRQTDTEKYKCVCVTSAI